MRLSLEKLGIWWHRFNGGGYCDLHEKKVTPGYVLCPDCTDHQTAIYTANMLKKWEAQAQKNKLESLVVMDNTVRAIRDIMARCETINDLEVELEKWETFQHRS